MAELIAQRYVIQQDLSDVISICSSGTIVDALRTNLFGLGPEVFFSGIEAGLESGVFTYDPLHNLAAEVVGQKEQYIAAALAGNDQAQRTIRRLRTFLVMDETRNRDLVLGEFHHDPHHNENGQPRRFRQQTHARPDAHIILAVDDVNRSRVVDVYNGSGHRPWVDTLLRYAGVNEELDGQFGRQREVYRALRDKISEAIPEAVNRAFSSAPTQ